MNYSVRRAKKKDKNIFLDLHESVFGGWSFRNESNVFRWKYEEGVEGEELPIFLVFSGDVLVGARGYVVSSVTIDSKAVLGFQSSDLMVHPEHRGQGVFRRLNEYCDLVHSEAGKRLLFSFPRPRPREGYREGGWKIYANPEYIIPSLSRSTAASILHSPSLALVDGPRIATRLAAWPALAGWSRFLESYTVRVEPWGERHIERAVSLVPYCRNIAYVRTPEFYQWRLSEPGKDFYAVTLYRNGEATGLAFFNRQWGRIFIREVLAKPGAGLGKYALLLYEVIRQCGMRQSYQIWSGLPPQLLSWLGFVDVGKRGDFRHDIAVRGYNLEPREEEWVHEVFSRGESGLSLLDFDC